MAELELISAFESVCSSNGDDVAFYVSPTRHGSGTRTSTMMDTTSSPNTSTCTGNDEGIQTVGFSELNENVNIIASELHFRHSVNVSSNLNANLNANVADDNESLTSSSTSTTTIVPTLTPTPWGCVLIVSSHPSPGEAAAVLACTKLRTPFVPLSIHGPHRVSESRIKTIIEETKPIAAIVITSIEFKKWGGEEWDENRPALSNIHDDIMIDLDSNHETIRTLNRFGIHRIVTIDAKDGTVIGPITTGGSLEFNSNINTSIADINIDSYKNDDDLESSLQNSNPKTSTHTHENKIGISYILYTSGSTNNNKPKAVIQTYRGILNRIKWQWKTFPLVQQMKRKIGYMETIEVLSQDGIVGKFNGYDHGNDGNDIVLRRTPLSFVDSIAEIYGTLLAGVPLWCPLYNTNDEFLGRGMGLIEMLDLAYKSGIKITRLTCLPSQLSQALRIVNDTSSINGDKSNNNSKRRRRSSSNNNDSSSSSSSDHNDSNNHNVIDNTTETISKKKDSICQTGTIQETKENYDNVDTMPICSLSNNWIHSLNLVIVSGEACPMSLIATFEEMMINRKAILVNLYGQTESSGDVSCMVVGFGGNTQIEQAQTSTAISKEAANEQISVKSPVVNHSKSSMKLVSRFPEACKYFWERKGRAHGEMKGTESYPQLLQSGGNTISTDRLKRILVPCGLPIDGHKFVIKRRSNGDHVQGEDIGCLHIEGTGIALGYLNNQLETSMNFSTIEKCNMDKQIGDESAIVENASSRTRILFNAMDLAFQDEKSGLLYIVGRAPQHGDDENIHLMSLTMGKINGVMIHVAEMETVFCTAFKAVMSQNQIVLETNFDLCIVGALLNDESFSGHGPKSVMFVDVSSFPKGSVETTRVDNTTNKLNNSTIIDHCEISLIRKCDISFQDLFAKTRSLLTATKFSSYHCHPAMVPNHIFLVSSIPRNGAAGKIDRKALVVLAKSELQKKNPSKSDNKDKDLDSDWTSNLNDELFSMQDIVNIYNQTLGIQVEKSILNKATFLELGGDSMMAIDAAHRIVKVTRSKIGHVLSSHQIITANDLFQNTIQSIYDIIIDGRGADDGDTGADTMMIQHKSKRPRYHYNRDENGCDVKLALENLPDVKIYNEKKNCIDGKIKLAWKLPLQMCVDASPIIIPMMTVAEGSADLVIVGSQGGDIAIVDTITGKAKSRMSVKGKIEGDISFMKTTTKSEAESNGERGRYFLFVCSYDFKRSTRGDLQRVGYIHTFELFNERGYENESSHSSRTATNGNTWNNDMISTKRLWEYEINGELKNKPIVFRLKETSLKDDKDDCCHRVIIGSYNGTVSYLNAKTGKVLDTIVDVGGAIHADPIIIFGGASTTEKTKYQARALIVSSTWTGKVSCLHIDKESIGIIWQIDIGSPIYATPLFDKNHNTAIIFAIDGSIRSVSLKNGEEIWVNLITNRPIFSSGCFIQPMITNLIKNTNIVNIKKGIDEQLIVFGCHDGFVRCVSCNNGDLKWKFDAKSAILGTPLAIDNMKRVIVTTSAGIVISLDSYSGSEDKESVASDGEIFSSPCASSWASEGTPGCTSAIYFGCRDSCMYKVWV